MNTPTPQFNRKTILIILVIVYLIPGLLLLWSQYQSQVVQIGGGETVTFFQNIPTLLLLFLLGPLVIGGFVFFSLVIPGLISGILILLLLFKRKYIFALSLLLTILFIFGSLFIPVTVQDKVEQSNVHLGLPLKFVVQNQSHYDPPFPAEVRYYAAAENPTHVLWPQFLFSFFIVLIFFTLVLLGTQKVLFLSKKTVR